MTTFLTILTEISSLLKTNIKVFDEAFAYCRKDEEKGLTVTAGNESQCVSINDVSGNYFYIRASDKMPFVVGKSLSDCSVAGKHTMPCSLIAVVKEADEFKLSDALINELLKTKVVEVKAVWIDPVAIIAEEYKGLDKKVIEKAKSRIGNRIIVRIDFDLFRNFNTHNCEYNICKTC
jgi:hypothetical protein